MHPQFQGRAYGKSPGTLPEVGYTQELVSGYATDDILCSFPYLEQDSKTIATR
jgi:hypothetical protein